MYLVAVDRDGEHNAISGALLAGAINEDLEGGVSLLRSERDCRCRSRGGFAVPPSCSDLYAKYMDRRASATSRARKQGVDHPQERIGSTRPRLQRCAREVASRLTMRAQVGAA